MGKMSGETVEITIRIKVDEHDDIVIYFGGEEHGIPPVTVRGKEYARSVPEGKQRLHKKLYERFREVLIRHDHWPKKTV